MKSGNIVKNGNEEVEHRKKSPYVANIIWDTHKWNYRITKQLYIMNIYTLRVIKIYSYYVHITGHKSFIT